LNASSSTLEHDDSPNEVSLSLSSDVVLIMERMELSDDRTNDECNDDKEEEESPSDVIVRSTTFGWWVI
jgi:hypothetical protein